jgi:hypothetical protein
MAAYNSFKKLLKDANLNPELFGMHSPRVGAATDAHADGIPGYIIDLRGRWKSSSMKKRYCRPPKEIWMKTVLNKSKKL